MENEWMIRAQNELASMLKECLQLPITPEAVKLLDAYAHRLADLAVSDTPQIHPDVAYNLLIETALKAWWRYLVKSAAKDSEGNHP